MLKKYLRTSRYRTGRRRKIIFYPSVKMLLEVYHPRFGSSQRWYVAEVKMGEIEAIIVEETPDGPLWNSALISVPYNAPYSDVFLPGVAAALGLATVASAIERRKMIFMDELRERLWRGSVDSHPFKQDGHWRPLIYATPINKLSDHGGWKLVTRWDEAVRKSKYITDAYKYFGQREKRACLFKQKLRHLSLPCAEKPYIFQRIRLLGLDEVTSIKVYPSLARPND